MLPGLTHLFDLDRAWRAFCDQFGAPEVQPDRLRVEHFVYRPGVRAVVGYVAERDWDGWVAEEQFAIELLGSEERLFRFPDDPYLPGLAQVADPLSAHELLPRCVSLHPQRLLVDAVRYRPTTKAVLRHHAHWRRKDAAPVVLYVRVMPPTEVRQFLMAGELAEQSGFVLPRLAGCYEEGGVAWLANVPGKTVRQLIVERSAPAPEELLACLASLWDVAPRRSQPLDLMGRFRHSERILEGALAEGAQHPVLRLVLEGLRPFAEAWRPSALAHNDFYDDQMILTDSGRIALVDFEEVGPGDPLLDIGTMLAHLRWMASFVQRETYEGYSRDLREAALRRFGWERRALDLREAYVLLGLASNPIRHFADGSLDRVETVLTMSRDVLES